ncbi:putative membrane protein, partial [Vibrio harveyi]
MLIIIRLDLTITGYIF